MVEIMNDPLSDFLTRIKNGYLARKTSVPSPYSKERNEVAKVLQEKGYLEKVEVKTSEKGFKEMVITLKYSNGKSVITDLKRVSKPGLRVYVRKAKLPRVLSGLGIGLVSTSHGVMTDKEARKKGFGGELIAKVW